MLFQAFLCILLHGVILFKDQIAFFFCLHCISPPPNLLCQQSTACEGNYYNSTLNLHLLLNNINCN